MASRRDELDAYAFARRRMVGAFLLPGGGGGDEDAPRPLRAVLPGLVAGAVAVAGFGVWGVFRPSAPLHWDDGRNVVQGERSTTRYVVLTDPDGRTKRLHQVLNMSSARLVLPVGAKVVVVDDDVLDRYPNHGPTIGIPYAPDKLPGKENVSRAMTWSVCDRPGSDARQETVDQALFVTAGADAAALGARGRVLGPDELLLVQQAADQQVTAGAGPGDARTYLVDAQGRRHPIGSPQAAERERKSLITAVFGPNAVPQPVRREWLDTLLPGSAVVFPQVDGVADTQGANSTVALQNQADRRIGRLVHYRDRDYVVGRDRLFLVTPFQAELIRQNPAYQMLYRYDPDKRPHSDEMTPSDHASFGTATPLPNAGDGDWPLRSGAPVNDRQERQDARTVVCSTFDGVAEDGRTPRRSVWAGPEYPAHYDNGAGAAYVTPGHGLFYRALDNGAGGSGTDFLITETGLRYSVPANGDGGRGPSAPSGARSGQGGAVKSPGSPAGTAAQDQAQPSQQPDEPGGNQARLGYQGVRPLPVPRAWSDLVPAGPPLSASSAAQQQNA